MKDKIEEKESDTKQNIKIKEEKLMTMKEFQDKYKINVYKDMEQLIFINTKYGNETLEIIYNMHFNNLKN